MILTFVLALMVPHGEPGLDSDERLWLNAIGIDARVAPATCAVCSERGHEVKALWETPGLWRHELAFFRRSGSTALSFAPADTQPTWVESASSCCLVEGHADIGAKGIRHPLSGEELGNLRFQPSALVLQTKPGDSLARGEVSVWPRAGVESVEVSRLGQGCSLRCDPLPPFAVGTEGRTIRVAYDPRAGPLPSNVALLFGASNGWNYAIPMVAGDIRAPIRAEPEILDLRHRPEAEVQIRAQTGLLEEIRILKLPPCLQVESIDGVEGSIGLRFRSNGFAGGRHECSSIRILARMREEVEPWALRVGVRHPSELRGTAGEPLMAGLYFPGERIELMEGPQGRRALFLPDRLPCMRIAAAAAGWSLRAQAQAPESLDPNVRVLWRAQAGEAVPDAILWATSTNGLAELLPSWAKACEDR